MKRIALAVLLFAVASGSCFGAGFAGTRGVHGSREIPVQGHVQEWLRGNPARPRVPFVGTGMVVSKGLGPAAVPAASFSKGMAKRRGADPWLGADKSKHFAGSVFLSAFGYYLARREQHWRDRPSRWFAIGFGLAFGVGKEIRDSWRPQGRASWKDLVADFVGCLVGSWAVAVPDGTSFGGAP